MPFNPEFPFGEKFRSDNDTQAGFVSLFAELALADEPPEGEDLVAELQEAMTPSHLVAPEICKKLPIYGKVKQFLERNGVDVPITEESGTLIAKRLICRIWGTDEFTEDRQDAFALFEEFRSGKKQLSTSPHVIQHQATTDFHPNNNISGASSNRSVSNDVAKRFSHESSKFSGDSNESFAKFVESYSRMSEELDLSDEMKKKFFHHLLRDHALEFYRDNIEKKVASYDDIVKCMEEEFCSSVKMETIARTLETIHISHFEQEDRNEEEALKELAKKIQELSPQAPTDCRSDRFRKRILHNATCGRDWALNVSSSTNFIHLSYQNLLHELQNSLQQYALHKKRNKETDDDEFIRKNRIAETNFAGQGRYYPNARKFDKKNLNEYMKKCWNCGELNCSVNRCPKPKDPRKIRMNRIKHFEAKNGRKFDRRMTEALFQFSEEYFEEEVQSTASDDDSNNEVDDANNERDAEIHHILMENKETHLASSSLNSTMGF